MDILAFGGFERLGCTTDDRGRRGTFSVMTRGHAKKVTEANGCFARIAERERFGQEFLRVDLRV